MSAAIRNNASFRNWEATGFSQRKQHVLATRFAPELCSPLPVTTVLDPPSQSEAFARYDRAFAPVGEGPVVHADCGSGNPSANPIELPVRMDCRIKSGNDKGERTKEKRKRNADRRVQPTSAPYGAGLALVSIPSPARGGGLRGTLACRRSTTALTVGAFGP
ncbi:MAG: hypothetical protein ACLPX7_20080 [Xanthobacteraceae bacterium]